MLNQLCSVMLILQLGVTVYLMVSPRDVVKNKGSHPLIFLCPAWARLHQFPLEMRGTQLFNHYCFFWQMAIAIFQNRCFCFCPRWNFIPTIIQGGWVSLPSLPLLSLLWSTFEKWKLFFFFYWFGPYLVESCTRVRSYTSYRSFVIRPPQSAQPAYQLKNEKWAQLHFITQFGWPLVWSL